MDHITQILTGFGGLAVFAIVFADQAGLPIPAPPLLLAAGSLAAGGHLDPVMAAGMTAAAALLADLLWFYLGRKGSGRALHLLSRWSFSRNASSAHAAAVVARYGLLALAVAKFLPGAVMPSLAGALGMSTRRFLVFDGLASLFYGGCYITTGFLFHNQIQQVMVWFDRVGHGVIGLGLVLLVGYVAYKFVLWRRTRSGKGQSSNLPDKKTGLADDSASVAHPDHATLVTDGPQSQLTRAKGAL
ncbi:MAG TPA: VTT domain-containing protein [Verrucomicrobiae bacterium]|nr:VTT domain-containing protein [Verrucomicrobiae bacterium]